VAEIMRILARLAVIVLGAVYGAAAGGGAGCLLGVLLAPAVVSGQPLVHEWYTLMVFAYMIWAAIGGAVVGGLIGAAPHRETVRGAALGRLIGTCGGAFYWAGGMEPWAQKNETGLRIIAPAAVAAWVGAVAGMWTRTRLGGDRNVVSSGGP
jgi:hypothetical protein